MKRKYFLVILTLFSLVFFTYIDVLKNPQTYYDDVLNIFNSTIATRQFNLSVLKKVLSFSLGGFRPVSYLSFYITYLFWGNGIEHLYPFVLFNVILHFLNSLIAFFVCLKITKGDFKVSFLTSIAFAISPVNSLSVSYLVQRMTELMFFFGMLSFLSFVYFIEKRRWFFLFFSLFSLVLSILSKESGVLFIPFFIVYLVWFDFVKVEIKKVYLFFILFYLFFLIVAGYYYLPLEILRGLPPVKRVLTETRVIVFYLKSLFIPFRKDIFLYLYFPLSQSILSPVSTLISTLFLALLFFLSFFLFKRDRLISFSILSFFLFHSIEASSIPLYIAFLHRNYLPSVFVYLAFFHLLFTYVKKEFVISVVVILFLSNLLFVSKAQNALYTSPLLYLSEDYRVNSGNKDLYVAYGLKLVRVGRYREAIGYYLKSFRNDRVKNRIELLLEAFYKMGNLEAVVKAKNLIESPVVYNLVGNACKKLGRFKEAEVYFEKSLKIQFRNSTFFSYLDLLAKRGEFDRILDLIDRYKTKVKGSEQLLIMYEINSYIETGRFEDAEKLFSKLESKNVYYWLKARFFFKKKEYKNAINLLKKIDIKTLTPSNLFIETQKVLLLSRCYAMDGDFEKGIEILEKSRVRSIYPDLIEKEVSNLRGMKDEHR